MTGTAYSIQAEPDRGVATKALVEARDIPGRVINPPETPGPQIRTPGGKG